MISKRITSLILLIAGFAVIFDYFVVSPELAALSLFLMKLATVLAAFALGIAAVSLFRLHVPIIMKRVKGEWYYSAWMIFVLAMTAIIGVFGGTGHEWFQWLFTNIFSPLGATMFAMLGFFIISAAYRAFRARTLDTTVLLLVGALIMLMNMPMGAVIWSEFPVIGAWLRDIPAVAGYRGVMIALAVGVVAYSIRVLIGYEKTTGE